MRFAAMAALVAGLGTSALAGTDFKLTGDNTKVTFVGSKPDGKHTGGFKELSGTATVDTDKVSFDITFDMKSTFSDNEKLTEHLKSPDFFGVKSNPKSMFKGTATKGADGKYTVAGQLTLAGKSGDVSFPAEIAIESGRIKIDADFSIDRNDFGITYGKGKIDDKVKLAVKADARSGT